MLFDRALGYVVNAATILVVVLAAWGSGSNAITLAPVAPIRAAFVYEWFPETWADGTHFTPALGRYDSGNQTIIASHIAAMQWGRIDAGIASWWGQGTPTDKRFPALLAAAKDKGFKWSAYYEPEGYRDPTPAQIGSDLVYLSRYTADPDWLRIGGRPVLFVYGSGSDGCEMATRWAGSPGRSAFYLVLKVFGGYRTCAAQPDSWHQYGPASRTDSQAPYSYSISPGFWKASEPAPRLTRDPVAWRAGVCSMIASGSQWQLITTFNEWGEGSAVEPAAEWQSSSGYGTYLDTLRSPSCTTPSSSPSPSAVTATLSPFATPTATSTPVALTPSPTPATPSPVPSGSSPPISTTVVAAGDIAGDSTGDTQTAAVITSLNPTKVLTLGDNCYNSATLACFQTYYDPTWGAFKAKTHPAVGNHDSVSGTFSGFRSYFGFGSAPLYYSWDLAGWHFIALDSEGAHDASSAQVAWLKRDLAAHPVACTLAYWHRPFMSSGSAHGSDVSFQPFWDALVAAKADVVLTGHDHGYERFAPVSGIRSFVVGTGGRSHYAFGTPASGSLVRNADTFGVLKLDLSPSGYTWHFAPVAGKTFTDAGAGVCQ